MADRLLDLKSTPVAELATTEPSHILDNGCGWDELLLKLLAACPHAMGPSLDHDEALVERGAAAQRPERFR